MSVSVVPAASVSLGGMVPPTPSNRSISFNIDAEGDANAINPANHQGVDPNSVVTINGEKVTKVFVMNNYNQLLMDRYLFMFQFTEDEIKKFVDRVSMKRILITQKLSMKFVIEYILNSKYHVNDSDSSLVIDDVLQYQPHLTRADYETQRQIIHDAANNHRDVAVAAASPHRISVKGIAQSHSHPSEGKLDNKKGVQHV